MIINDDYKKQLEEMHSDPKKFSNGRKAYKIVSAFLKENQFDSLIDFGCGKGGLIECVKELHPEIKRIQGYDPGYKEFEKIPDTKFDALVSTDALEHVEPEYIDQTLKTIDSLFTKYCFLRIACYPAKKKLPDGRNAHLIVESPKWWLNKLKENVGGEVIYKNIMPFKGTPKKGPPILGEEIDLIIKK